MRKDFLPFSRPSISETEIEAVADVLRSGWITTGPKAAELERAFCDFVGAKDGVALTSATAGMHVTLAALGIGSGDEVVTPSMTWVSTVNLIELLGAKPVFVDVDRDTLMASPEAYEAAITEKTRAIIPVHFAGASVDLAPLRDLAQRKGVLLIEDAAHAAGTRYGEDWIGQQGTAIFSFHPIKNVTTGEGGMIVSEDAAFLDRVRRLKFHGLGVDAFDRRMQGRAPQAEVLEPGFKYNLPDILAVLGLGQLARLNEFNARRTELAALYRERLARFDEVLPLGLPDYAMTHAWHLFIVRVTGGLERQTFMEGLKARNVGTGIHFRAVHTQRYYRERYGFEPGYLPNTEWNSERICSLPLFPDMTVEDVDSVADAIESVLSSARSSR